jgi:hypothetical protein
MRFISSNPAARCHYYCTVAVLAGQVGAVVTAKAKP